LLFFYKKAISYFIPNKHHLYDVQSGRGNPTKSPQVNELIKDVQQYEVRAQGVPSQARRDITVDEYREIINITKQHTDFGLTVRLPCMTKFQIHLIARVDDTTHIFANELKIHPKFPFALSVKLRWTKNCREERHAPPQIILGAMDSSFCVLSSLAIYLQYVLEFANASHSTYLFCNFNETPDSVKKQVSSLLMQRLFKCDDWQAFQAEANEGDDGPLGTHSLRKLGSTTARLMGRTQNEVEVRGRWKNTLKVSSQYTSVDLPIIDANVAASLCIGGPCKYDIEEGSGISDHWLANDFVPHIKERYGCSVAYVLGRALLWSFFDADTKNSIPQGLLNCLHFRFFDGEF
jgi:hypothetical protein